MAFFFAALIELATIILAGFVFLGAGMRTTGATDADRWQLCKILTGGTVAASLVFVSHFW